MFINKIYKRDIVHSFKEFYRTFILLINIDIRTEKFPYNELPFNRIFCWNKLFLWTAIFICKLYLPNYLILRIFSPHTTSLYGVSLYIVYIYNIQNIESTLIFLAEWLLIWFWSFIHYIKNLIKNKNLIINCIWQKYLELSKTTITHCI